MELMLFRGGGGVFCMVLIELVVLFVVLMGVGALSFLLLRMEMGLLYLPWFRSTILLLATMCTDGPKVPAQPALRQEAQHPEPEAFGRPRQDRVNKRICFVSFLRSSESGASSHHTTHTSLADRLCVVGVCLRGQRCLAITGLRRVPVGVCAAVSTWPRREV
jgi:hypothetical protein